MRNGCIYQVGFTWTPSMSHPGYPNAGGSDCWLTLTVGAGPTQTSILFPQWPRPHRCHWPPLFNSTVVLVFYFTNLRDNHSFKALFALLFPPIEIWTFAPAKLTPPHRIFIRYFSLFSKQDSPRSWGLISTDHLITGQTANIIAFEHCRHLVFALVGRPYVLVFKRVLHS